MDQAEVLEDDLYAIDEAVEAFKSLTPSDRRNLKAIARVFANRGTLASDDELISEAYIRIAEGDRRWAKKDTFVVFLAGVIRSLASDRVFRTDARKVQRLKGGYAVVEQDDLSTVEDVGDSGLIAHKAMLEAMYDHLDNHFVGDDEMQLLSMGIQDGLKGKDLEAAVGVDTLRLAALRTRFKREVKKFIAARCAKEGQSND